MTSKGFINSHLLDLRPYKIVPQEIWTIDPSEWENVLKLDWNESTIEPPQEVKQEIVDFIFSRDFLHLYPSTQNKELVSLLSDYAGVPERNIQYFASSDALHEYIAKLYIGKGDKVLTIWPSYDNFRSTAEASCAELIYAKMNKIFEIEVDKLQEEIAYHKPKIVYICNPNNPTGQCLKKESIKELIEKFPRTLFLVDEAYCEFSGVSVNEYVVDHDNLLVSHTLSKAFAMANIRFGYLVSSLDNIDAINRIRNPKNIPTLTQVAAIAALKNRTYMFEYLKKVIEAREWFYNKLNCREFEDYFKVYPSSANFILIECNDIATKSKIYYGLRKERIYVRQLTQNPSMLCCLRITIGTLDQMQRVYNTLKSIDAK